MRALGANDLPETISVNDRAYRHEKTVKHDFFAATGFYRAEDGSRGVLKIGRTTRFFGLPLKWVGRRLCQRELNCYRRLADLPNVPKVLGVVGETGFLHEYVPGRPLAKDKPVPDDFFAQLQTLLAELHRRNIAYVDTNKPENILLGDDGRPYLIDFQISYVAKRPNWWLRRLQRADIYHILKHKRRMRRDQLTPEEEKIVARRGLLIHLHRIVSKPYFFVRRRLFKWLRRTGRILPEGSK
jgi:RIO-like serine/threonine protein kinase